MSMYICTGSSEPHYSTETSCAGSNGDLCSISVTSECCGESALATMAAHLCNHQFVVSKRKKCPQYVVIMFFASLSRLEFRESDVSPGQIEVKQGKFVEFISWAKDYFREI